MRGGSRYAGVRRHPTLAPGCGTPSSAAFRPGAWPTVPELVVTLPALSVFDALYAGAAQQNTDLVDAGGVVAAPAAVAA